MDDPNEENIETNWVMINSVDVAEEATVLDYGRFLDDDQVNTKQDTVESDMESDGISIISESSHLHEGSTEEDSPLNNEDVSHDVDKVQDNTENTSSDSASQTKTNWTFVDPETSPPEMGSSNQFYLNCLQEPVQELSEHELGSVQSDLDSDGISIISDCDSLNDFTEDNKKIVEGFMTKENSENEDAELVSKLPSGIKKYCNGVLIGTILLAMSSIFLGQYFNSVDQIEEDLPIYKEEFNNDLKEKVPEKINDFKGKYEVPTALAYCQERHKSDGMFIEHNVKKCLNKIEKRMRRKKENALKEEEINKLKKYLKVKEQFLEEKEKFLIKREYELLKAEMRLKNENFRRNRKGEKNGDIKVNRNIEETASNQIKEETKVDKEPIINVKKKKNHKEDKKEKHFKSKPKFEKPLKNPYKNHKMKNQPFSEYNKNKEQELKQKIEKNYKIKNNFEKRYIKNKHIDEQIQKTTSETLKNDNLVHENSKEDKLYDKTKDKKVKGSTNYIILGGHTNDNETISGYWVGKLYKGRSDLRNKRHSGDWYFDRASYRKTKRDKAKWYFDWMMDRELLRYRRSYYM